MLSFFLECQDCFFSRWLIPWNCINLNFFRFPFSPFTENRLSTSLLKSYLCSSTPSKLTFHEIFPRKYVLLHCPHINITLTCKHFSLFLSHFWFSRLDFTETGFSVLHFWYMELFQSHLSLLLEWNQMLPWQSSLSQLIQHESLRVSFSWNLDPRQPHRAFNWW